MSKDTSLHPSGTFFYKYNGITFELGTMHKREPNVIYVDSTLPILLEDVDMINNIVSCLKKTLSNWAKTISERHNVYIDDYSDALNKCTLSPKKLINIQVYMYKNTNLKWKEIGIIYRPYVDELYAKIEKTLSELGITFKNSTPKSTQS